MDTKMLIGGGAIAGILAGFWSGVKFQLQKVWSLVFVKVEVGSNELGKAFCMWLWRNCRCSFVGTTTYVGWVDYVQPLQKNQLVAYLTPPREKTVWFRGWRPLWVETDGHKVVFSFVRGTFKRDVLILDAVKQFNSMSESSGPQTPSRFRVRRMTGSLGRHDAMQYNRAEKPTEAGHGEPRPAIETANGDKDVNRPVGWDASQIGLPSRCGSLGLMSLADHILAAFEEAVRWKKSEQWFKQRSVPWKRGWLLHGPPGCVLPGTKITVRLKKKAGRHTIHED